MKREDIRNIAIIAHVDHGKTTLVNEMLKQGGVFGDHEEVSDRVMDSGDLEKERGITILAKNTSAHFNGVKINIIDTPGHADFGGEVERVLKMVNGVLLLVDAFEGTMPQTRFVLERALALGHPVIVVLNKIDRPEARIYEIEEEILELLIDLGASNEQLDSPLIYASGREGRAGFSPEHLQDNLEPLFEKVIEYMPAPEVDLDAPFQMLVSSIDYNSFVGRIGIGRIERGKVKQNQEIVLVDFNDPKEKITGKAVNLYTIEGLERKAVTEGTAGDIVCISGIDNITIGHTVCEAGHPDPLPFVNISEPTMEMTFSVNNSPFAGLDGKFVTSRQIGERLERELLKDVSLRVEGTATGDTFQVFGRGEMHMAILIETMRREGYEFQVGTPRVLFREEDGVKLEPIEKLVVDTPAGYVGAVMERVGARKGELQQMNPQGDRTRMEFLVPTRGLLGYRSEFLTSTHGEGIMSSIFHDYAPYKGEIPRRQNGSVVAFEQGESTAYGLFGAQDRGSLFVGPGVPIYAGMVVGQTPKEGDLTVNICRSKQHTNVRASGTDEALRLVPARNLSLEESLEFIGDDELLEVTPHNLRIRKSILDHTKRERANRSKSK